MPGKPCQAPFLPVLAKMRCWQARHGTGSAAFQAANAAPGRAFALQTTVPAGQRPAAKRDARATNGSETAEAGPRDRAQRGRMRELGCASDQRERGPLARRGPAEASSPGRRPSSRKRSRPQAQPRQAALPEGGRRYKWQPPIGGGTVSALEIDEDTKIWYTKLRFGA
jgi:hypothetical protein